MEKKAVKHQNQYTLRAENSQYGLDIYLRVGGREYYIGTRRSNGLLWLKLKDGITLGELRRFKPKDTRTEQKCNHYFRYLLKIADAFIKNELVGRAG